MMRSFVTKNYKISGFTLVEILLVIVAIAVMMAVGLTAVKGLLSTVKFKSSREIFITDYNYVLVKSFSTSLTGLTLKISDPTSTKDSVLSIEGDTSLNHIKQLFLFGATPGLKVDKSIEIQFNDSLGCQAKVDGVTSSDNPQFKISYLNSTSDLNKCYSINLKTCKIGLIQCPPSGS